MNTNTHPRNLFRVIAGIFLASCLFGLAGNLCTGCVSRVPDVAASKIEFDRTTSDGAKIRFRLWSPREVEIGSVVANPDTGLVAMTNYNASPSAAALRAQVDERREMRETVTELRRGITDLGALAVFGYTGRGNLPTTAGPPLSPEALAQIAALLRGATNAPAIPDGFKLVPKDNPSKPRKEVE